MFHIYDYSDTDNKSSDESTELLLLMQQKLPEYVINCFHASGFDSEEVISTMDVTSDGSENTMKIMEAYMEKHYSHDPSMRSKFSASLEGPFEFPPGHKVKICNFVKEVKQNYNKKIVPVFNRAVKPSKPAFLPLPDSEQQSRKRSNATKSPGNHKKCKLSIEVALNETHSGLSNPSESKEHMQVKSSIQNWIDHHLSELVRSLNEDHYSINTINKNAAVTVHVHCKLCNTTIKLQPKFTKTKGIQHGISNWTKHVAPCYLERLKADSGQTKLTLKPIKFDFK